MISVWNGPSPSPGFRAGAGTMSAAEAGKANVAAAASAASLRIIVTLRPRFPALMKSGNYRECKWRQASKSRPTSP